jgi:hypothetical protein
MIWIREAFARFEAQGLNGLFPHRPHRARACQFENWQWEQGPAMAGDGRQRAEELMGKQTKTKTIKHWKT